MGGWRDGRMGDGEVGDGGWRDWEWRSGGMEGMERWGDEGVGGGGA